MDAVDLSVVVPVYGCDTCLRALHARVSTALAPLGIRYELILVDDRSPDNSWAVLEELAAEDSHLHLLRLSRNFGQHAAITAGLSRSRGRWVVVMDCDLQDPPEELPRLYAKAQEGWDVVFTRRRGRQHSFFRRLASKMYYALVNAALKTNLSHEVGAFSIASRRAVDAYLEIRDADRNYVMVLAWLGFEQTTLEYDHAARLEGKSSYTLGKLIRFAFDGLFFQTTTLLRWIIYVGFGISVLGVLLAVFLLVNYLVRQPYPYPGWTSLGILVLLLSGFIIMSTGLTGLYVGKIFTQVKGRPLFVVDEERVGAVTAERDQVSSSRHT